MKSTTGQHWLALDHVRALAALLVFTWHFIHTTYGFPIPDAGAPAIFPLAIFDEGQTGVALFMVLSGYLFAKLLHGREIRYGPFFWNRLLRLAPLLIVVMVLWAIVHLRHGDDMRAYLWDLATGFVLPYWPSGGWSITVEMHFYLLLPALIHYSRRSPWVLPAALLAGIALRTGLWLLFGEVQFLAYWTIVGRIDQFLFGIMAFRFRDAMVRQHLVALAVALAFGGYYWLFDLHGGWNALGGRYPSPSPLWIVMPTIEGAAYATLIAYYDTSYRPRNSGLGWLIGRAGAYSYSIYLLHWFMVFRMATFVHRHVMDLSNFYVALAWSVIGFALMVPVGAISYRFVEGPFLHFRRPYAIAPGTS